MRLTAPSRPLRIGRCAGLAVLLVLLIATGPSLAATITVTSTSGGTGGPDCTLRDAITAANTDAAVGGCAAGSGADVIELPAGATITLTEADNAGLQGANGLPLITSEITLNGNGATIERDAGLACNLDETTDAGEFRIAFVDNGADLTLNDVTLRNGCADGDPLGFAGDGGAVLVWTSASLSIDNGTISGNRASGMGGGLAASGADAVTLTQTAVTGNSAAGFSGGGGIRFAGVTLTVEDSVISGNQVTGGIGGGLTLDAGLGTLLRTALAGNSASSHAGGAYNFDRLRIVQSTISGNTTGGSGGGVLSTNIATELLVLNSTISGNSASTGGGIWNASAMQIGYSTLTENAASSDAGGLNININAQGQTLEILNSIVAGNSAGGDCGGAVNLLTVLGENLDGDGSCTGFSVQNADPMLAPLGNYGGPTLTHALYDGSPAIDLVPAGSCEDFDEATLDEDQRGVSRPQDGDGDSVALCDIGAYEQDAPLSPPPPPGPPGEPGSPVAIPTLGTWAMLLLGLVLAVTGFGARRVRSRS